MNVIDTLQRIASGGRRTGTHELAGTSGVPSS